MASAHKLGRAIPIQCHAWSPDRQTVAISHNNKVDLQGIFSFIDNFFIRYRYHCAIIKRK